MGARAPRDAERRALTTTRWRQTGAPERAGIATKSHAPSRCGSAGWARRLWRRQAAAEGHHPKVRRSRTTSCTIEFTVEVLDDPRRPHNARCRPKPTARTALPPSTRRELRISMRPRPPVNPTPKRQEVHGEVPASAFQTRRPENTPQRQQPKPQPVRHVAMAPTPSPPTEAESRLVCARAARSGRRPKPPAEPKHRRHRRPTQWARLLVDESLFREDLGP